MSDSLPCPKADALPGCATPRAAVSLGNAALDGKTAGAVRGNKRQNGARTGSGSPGDSTLPRFTTRAELEAWARGVSRGITKHSEMLAALDLIRRVTLAHQHLGDE